MCLALLGHEVLLCDVHLILEDVARDVNHLHTVAQRCRDILDVVGRSDEQYLREVVFGIEVVIVERGVLLRVEHLEQCARWVAVVRARHLVYLVEDNHRVRRATALYGLDDTARHSTDVCLAVTANLRLVVQTTERYAAELTAQSIGYGLAERRLTHSWRAIEAEYW